MLKKSYLFQKVKDTELEAFFSHFDAAFCFMQIVREQGGLNHCDPVVKKAINSNSRTQTAKT